MSDLISREALIEAMMDRGVWYHGKKVYELITNAPAVRGEALVILRVKQNTLNYMIDTRQLNELKDGSYNLYLSPQQPQSVAEALEDAAKICDKQVMRSWNSESDAYNKCAKDCAKEIRVLIKRNAEKEGE